MLGNKTGVLIDEFVFTGAFFNAETEHQVAELDNTTFGALATSAEPGLATDKLMLRGYYSGNQAGAVFNALRARMGAGGVGDHTAILIDTDDANCLAECSRNTWGQSLKVALSAPELITFDSNTAAAGTDETGVRINAGNIFATGTQNPSIDLGAGGAEGGRLYLFIHSITGTATNAQMKLQSATTQGGTYTDRGAITFSAVGGYSVALTATVDRYVRFVNVSMGGSTAITFTMIACVKGVTY